MPTPEIEGTPPPPSFRGRLELATFAFQATVAPPRRSSRLQATTAGPAISESTPTEAAPPAKGKGPAKRKAPSDSAAGPRKRVTKSSSYAPPSTYAHLPPLPDAVAPNLLIMFVGLNPGLQTARTGHAYSHPTNKFWRLLYSSGITPVLVPAVEDRTLPARFALGFTNIVARPSRNGAELSKAEMDAGVEVLEAKARRWRPEAVCIVGKSIWESIWRVRHGRSIKAAEFKYGWQDDAENMGVVGPEGQRSDELEEGVDYDDGPWSGARVFVATTTSGLAATQSLAEKERIWRELGEWVEKRRAQRLCS